MDVLLMEKLDEILLGLIYWVFFDVEIEFIGILDDTFTKFIDFEEFNDLGINGILPSLLCIIFY